jgi:hypothetical protein
MTPEAIVFNRNIFLNIPLLTNFHLLQTRWQAVIDDNLHWWKPKVTTTKGTTTWLSTRQRMFNSWSQQGNQEAWHLLYGTFHHCSHSCQWNIDDPTYSSCHGSS